MKLRSKLKPRHEIRREDEDVMVFRPSMIEPVIEHGHHGPDTEQKPSPRSREKVVSERGTEINLRRELSNNITSISQLKSFTEISQKEERRLNRIVERHPMSITPYYLSLIDWNDPDDPIRKMAVPSLNELDISGSYDTSGERENTKFHGLQHKYSQTALILLTNKCAMYCRHCFRKRLVGLPNEEILTRFTNAMVYVKQHPEINNILLSGGDPLMLSKNVLGKVLTMLSGIPHLKFIRIGSRCPVTFPARITGDTRLLALLKAHSLPHRRLYLITQFNHPREITEESTQAVASLLRSNVIVNNQTVLLKGVNDDPEVLADLSNQLVSIGVNPYYVFQCRPVKRVKTQFQLPLERGIRIVEDAKKLLNGHSKRFKYIMAHRTGKIEILGVMDGELYMKYHQAKNPMNLGRLFKRRLNPTAGWLDDLK